MATRIGLKEEPESKPAPKTDSKKAESGKLKAEKEEERAKK